MSADESVQKIVEVVQTTITETIRFARAAERLTTVHADLHRAVVGLSALLDADEALGPEIGATVEPLQAAVEAVERAMVFTATRLQTSLERVLEQPLEGWPT